MVIVALDCFNRPETAYKQRQLFAAGYQIGKEYRGKSIAQLCFVVEAWRSGRPRNDPRLDIAASEHPNRQECLIVQVLDVIQGKRKEEQKQSTYVVDMIRDDQDKLVELRPYDLDKVEEVRSPLLPSFLSGFCHAHPGKRDMLQKQR